MHMPNFVTKWRRDRAVSRVVRTGETLRKYYIARAGHHTPNQYTQVDVDYLDGVINMLERKIERDCAFIRKTA